MGHAPHRVELELLFDCLSPTREQAVLEILQKLPEEGWEELLALAERSGIGAVLCRRLLSPPLRNLLPERIARTVRNFRWASGAKTLFIHQDFRQVVPALQARRIPVIALKGLHLTGLVYGDDAVREMADMDLLVPKKELELAAALLEGLGYTPMAAYRIDSGPVPFTHHHLPRFQRGKIAVEIHWSICKPGSGPEIDIDQLWEGALSARIAGVAVKVLSPEDLLLHLCIHATYGHLCRSSARPWCDIAEIIRRHDRSLSWEKVISRARSWRCSRGVYLTLRLARDCLEAAVPEEVLRALKPSGFDERILSIAVKQGHNRELPLALARFWGAQSLPAKLRTLWEEIRTRKSELSLPHPPGSGAGRSNPVSPISLKEARRHWQTLVRLHRGDFALTRSARSTLTLHRFLSEE